MEKSAPSTQGCTQMGDAKVASTMHSTWNACFGRSFSPRLGTHLLLTSQPDHFDNVRHRHRRIRYHLDKNHLKHAHSISPSVARRASVGGGCTWRPNLQRVLDQFIIFHRVRWYLNQQNYNWLSVIRSVALDPVKVLCARLAPVCTDCGGRTAPTWRPCSVALRRLKRSGSRVSDNNRGYFGRQFAESIVVFEFFLPFESSQVGTRSGARAWLRNKRLSISSWRHVAITLRSNVSHRHSGWMSPNRICGRVHDHSEE